MAVSGEDRKRAEELSREPFDVTGGRFKHGRTSKTFAEIEDRAIEVTSFWPRCPSNNQPKRVSAFFRPTVAAPARAVRPGSSPVIP